MPRALPFLYAAEELENALTEKLTPVLAEADLTTAQFHVLYMLVEEGPMRLTDLAEQQRCVKSNISYIVRAMEKAGLVELTASPDDQRARVLTATKLGQKRYGIAKLGTQKIETALRRAYGGAATDELSEACLAAAAALDAM